MASGHSDLTDQIIEVLIRSLTVPGLPIGDELIEQIGDGRVHA